MTSDHQEVSVYLITSNTRIGGAQRIALDELYELSDRGIQAKLVSLSPSLKNDDILNVDKDFHPAKKIKICEPGSNKLKQVSFLIREFKRNPNKIYVLSHDFTGVLISRCAALASWKRIAIDLYIHQLMDMSDSRQRQKRIFLSLFASNVYVSSFQFKSSWEEYLNSSTFWKILYRKKILFDRMGVHVPRVLNAEFKKTKVCQKDIPHIIFMSRITAWKGFNVYFEFTKKFVNQHLHSLILTTKNGRPEIFDDKLYINELNHVVYESGVSNIEIPRGSVHLYPTNYGTGVSYPQSVGMNVLELLVVGIPSIISPESFLSWPELENSAMVLTNNWTDEEELETQVRNLCKLSESNVQAEIERLLPIISISNHIERVVGRSGG